MNKRTDGPWHWDSDPMTGDPLGRVRYRVTALGKTVTQLYHSSGDECAEADARLIASAPELLAALVALVERGTDSPEHLAAEAAIAKATGISA